jgi:hypothetical protein
MAASPAADAQQTTIAFNAATSSASEAAGIGNVVRVTTSGGGATASDVTVDVAVSGGTATPADYVWTGTLTVPAGTPNNALVSIASAITVVNDATVEPNETLRLTLSSPVGAVLGTQTTTTHMINNDDVAQVTIADVSQLEGDAGTSTMMFTVVVDNAVQDGFTLDYTTTGLTATTADGDFVTAMGTLMFSGMAGESHTFGVTINGDTKVEANETFRVSMPLAAGTMAPGSLVITDTAIGTITNDDTASVTIADVAVTEGNAGSPLMTFTATLSNAVPGGFTVNYATANGTATTADNDYVAATGTLTFSGAAGETRTFTVTINGDTKVESDETFTVSLNTVSSAAVTITDTATGTITNDDTATLTITDVAMTEGNAGTQIMIFSVALDNAVQGGFTVNYATADGTATTADGDYVAATGTLTFTGAAGQMRTIVVTINGDTKVEADETYTVSFNTVSNPGVTITDTGTGTIRNNDTATVTIADVSLIEGNAGPSTMTFTATLSNAVQGGITVNYATANGTATTADNDYVAATGTLTFAGTAGETQTFTVTINGDTKVEANETFTVSLNTVSNAAVNITDTATGTITNDDTSAVTIADVSRAEGNAGTSTLTFTATLDSAMPGGFTVNYATANGTATTGDADYVAATGTLTFAGIAGETQSFTVTINGDTKVEANETFTVSLNTVSNAVVNITDTATGTITNDDASAVTIADVTLAEGNAGTSTMTFTATLGNAVQGGFTVNYATGNGLATTADNDYVAATGTLTFAGTAGEAQTFNVTINGDVKVEGNETFVVMLNTSSNAAVTINDTAIGWITNDDASAVTIADVSLAEGDAGTSAMTFTATLSNAVQGGLTVNYATMNGTADVSDNDYAAAIGTLTFAGTAGETQTFTITVNGDAKVEPDETFTVRLFNASNAAVTVTDTATGTITNDDASAVTIADVSVDEGNTGISTLTFTATLGNAVQGGFTVNFASANGTATTTDNDYVAATGSLTFSGTAGETRTVRVTINGDTKVEADETFTLSLNTVSNAAVAITDTATGTIVNDDASAVTIADVSVAEGDAGTSTLTFTATLGNAVQGGLTVNYASANGTATTTDNDYAAATGTLTFAGTAGETETFTVTVNGDAKVEADETFTVSLNTVSNAAVTITDTATGTITNDDASAVTIADVSVTEGDAGTSTLTFTATLGNAVQGGFTVNYATANDTAATSDNDYLAATGTLTFAGTAGETQTFSVTINGDTKVESDEAFIVWLNTASNAAVDITDTATGTITNDDASAVTIADVSVAEGNTGTSTLTFTATLGNAVQGGFTVNYATANGTATTTDNDYLAATGTLTFAGTAGETQTIAVTINGDTKVETDEAFTVSLNTASNAAVTVTDTATGTITNDDASAVTIADVSVTEGNTGTSTLMFTATLGNAVQGGFTVNYATANGTATTTDNDYVAATGTLAFAGTAGETQTFAVTINGDVKVEADEAFTVALNTVSNAAVTITDTATGTITNDDASAVTIADVSGTEGNAGTSTLTFTATLGSAVQGGFTVNYATANGTATTTDNDYVAASGTLTFAGTAGETQTFTVTVNGDIRFESDETFAVALSGPSNASVTTTDTATGTILNDDTAPGIVVAPASVQTTEAGGSATFTVVLAAQPTATVTVPLSSGDTTEGTVSPASLSFGTNDWNIAQTVTVTGVDDAIVDGTVAYTIVVGAASSADPAYDGIDATDVTASNLDNDTAGVQVTPTALDVTEGGAGASYAIVLQSEPVGGSVTVGVTVDSQLTATPSTLVFTATNWNVAQTVTIDAVDDTIAEGTHTGTITHAVSGADYAAVVASSVVVTIADNDTSGIVVSPTAGLVTTEAGGTATFTVVLASQPTADVGIALSSSDTSEGTVSPAALTFTAANWNVAQTVTLTGVDDTVVDGDVPYTIVTAAATSADARYTGVDAADVAASNRDDDAAAALAATKRVTQIGTATQPVIYEIVVTNTGAGMQADDPASDEMVDALPASLALEQASASAGSLVADTAANTVRWNGALAPGASATIEIRAIVVTTAAGPISNRARLNYDSNGDGGNDATALSDDPTTPGADATVFVFVPVAALPTPVPLLGPWTLAWLTLGIAGMGLRRARRRVAP